MVIRINLDTGDVISVTESESTCNEDELYESFARSTLHKFIALTDNKKAHEPSKFNGQF